MSAVTDRTIPDAGPERDALKAVRTAGRASLAASVKRSYQTRELEWLSAAFMLWWSFALVQPGDLLAQPGFAAFHAFPVTEIQWAWIFGICGAGRIVALYINGRWPKGPYIRIFGALFGVMTWPQIAYMVSASSLISYGHFLTTGTGIYSGLFVVDLMAMFRASRDARYYSR